MGKISGEAKKRYFEKIKEYKTTIEQVSRREKSILEALQTDENGASYKKIMLADETLNQVSYFLIMNELSVSLLGVRNEAYLNDARKGCYKSIIYLEEVVTNLIDVPFSEYEEKLDAIEDVTDEQRWQFIRKLGFAIQSVQEGFGENTKWKWSFVEIEGRYTTITKNLLNMKTIVAGMDPRVPGYETRMAHLALTKRLLQQAADRYRQKYELSTLRIDDFKLAIGYLSSLRRLHMLLGENNEADVVKKKADVWKAKMESDSKKLDQGKKRPAGAAGRSS